MTLRSWFREEEEFERATTELDRAAPVVTGEQMLEIMARRGEQIMGTMAPRATSKQVLDMMRAPRASEQTERSAGINGNRPIPIRSEPQAIAGIRRR